MCGRACFLKEGSRAFLFLIKRRIEILSFENKK